MTMLQRVVTVVGIVFVICTYWLGYYHGKQSVKLDDFKEYKAAVEARDALQEKLNASDVELQKKQQELKEARAKKSLKKSPSTATESKTPPPLSVLKIAVSSTCMMRL